MEESFAEVAKVHKLLNDFSQPWYIAGGWAIDLFIGNVTRIHSDIEIAVLRKDQITLKKFLSAFEFTKAVNGTMESWNQGEWLELPIHEIHAQSKKGESTLEILLNESSQDNWRFRRNLEIVRPLSMIGLYSDIGVPFLAPEIVLLYKAKNPRAKDEDDFNRVCALLNLERRVWLREAMSSPSETLARTTSRSASTPPVIPNTIGLQNFILVEEKSCWVQATVALILVTIVITAINRSQHNAMTNTAVSISQADIQALEQLYTFRERTEVVEFLDKHPFLVPVLLTAPDKIRHYFPDSQLFLEVVPDAEIIDWVQIVLSILIKLDPYDTVKRLNQMDMDWWVHNPYFVRKNVCILPEYPDEF